jgi:hypothetical protein
MNRVRVRRLGLLSAQTALLSSQPHKLLKARLPVPPIFLSRAPAQAPKDNSLRIHPTRNSAPLSCYMNRGAMQRTL